MSITVFFHSYFKELAGCSTTTQDLPQGSTLQDLVRQLHQAYPRLRPMERSTLMAVGVEYQPSDYQLVEGDQVSLFPPVQGG